MIKKFEPFQTPKKITEAELIAQLKKGEFNIAIKIANRLNKLISEYPNEVMYGVRKLIVSKRASELLSFINKNPGIFNIDVVQILRVAYRISDYHSFLKNCIRFKITNELKNEICDALSKIRPIEAESWKKKFNSLGLTDI